MTFEYDIGAMPSFIPYTAEKFIARGYDVTNGLERLKIVTACPVGKGHMNVNSEGGVMPCQFAQDWTIGNIREMTLRRGDRGALPARPQEPRASARRGVRLLAICLGCRTKAWHAAGDPMAEDPTCILAPASSGRSRWRSPRARTSRRARRVRLREVAASQGA